VLSAWRSLKNRREETHDAGSLTAYGAASSVKVSGYERRNDGRHVANFA